MIRPKDYLKSRYETGDIPTQEDFSDLIDSCYGNVDSQSSGNTVSIPTLQLFSKTYYNSNISSTSRSQSDLISFWSSPDTSFLDHNPEIWLFRYRNRSKQVDPQLLYYINHKKYAHTPHLNGIKYPNSNLYSGSIDSIVPEIKANGVKTEWPLKDIGGMSGNTQIIVPLDPYDWFYKINETTGEGVLVNDSMSITGGGYYMKILGRKGKPGKIMSFPFKLAIVIDDPLVPSRKVIGPLSNRIYLRYIPDRFIYEFGEINLSKARYNW